MPKINSLIARNGIDCSNIGCEVSNPIHFYAYVFPYRFSGSGGIGFDQSQIDGVKDGMS
jgi:hypothetical protein